MTYSNIEHQTALTCAGDVLLTVEEASRYLRVHPITIRRLIGRKHIAAFKVGRVWRIRKAWIDSLSQG